MDRLPAGSAEGDEAGRHRLSYWVTAFTFLALQAFATVPSPLYGLYAQRDGFSPLTITLIYAAYAAGVAASLFFAGHLSDHHGRRPLLFVAVALDAASAVIFITSPGLAGLFAARVLCGLAVGISASTATAYLSELYVAHRPRHLIHRAQFLISTVTLGGLGVGALAAGLLAQYAPRPLTLPYLVMLAAFAVSAAGLGVSAETRPRVRPLPAYRPQRAAAPPHAKSAFVSALVGVGLAYAVMGMFIGLAGTFLVVVLHEKSLALAGAAVFVVFAAGVATTAAMSRKSPRTVLAAGVMLTIAGLALVVTSAWLPRPSLALFLIGGAVIGAGGSTLFKGSLTVVIGVSPPSRLAESLASFYLSGYTGISVPVIALGVALHYASARDTLLGFAVVIAAGTLSAAPSMLRYRPQAAP